MPFFMIMAELHKPDHPTFFYIKTQVLERPGTTCARICWVDRFRLISDIVYFRDEAEMREDMACQQRYGQFALVEPINPDTSVWLRSVFIMHRAVRGAA